MKKLLLEHYSEADAERIATSLKMQAQNEAEEIKEKLPDAERALAVKLLPKDAADERAAMLEVLGEDYVRTARAKGLPERTVIFKHAIKNALIPVVSIIGLQIHFYLGGSVIIESIFRLPGIGHFFFEALSRRDYPVVSSINLIVATFTLLLNLIVDFSYAYLDPRIRYR